MLRKDVKLGMAIGGVLLAVLVVYVLVVTGPQSKNEQVSLVTSGDSQQPDPAASPQAPAESHPVIPAGSAPGPTELRDPFAGPSAQPAAAQPAADPAAAPPAPRVQDAWAMALNSGKLPELMTQTPTPAAPEPSAIVPTGANTPSGAAGAASLSASNVPLAVGPTTQPGAIPGTYKVKPGETFSSIAAEFYGNSAYYPHLIRANPTIDARRLRPGMTITLPPLNEVKATSTAAPAPQPPLAVDSRSEYRVETGDSLYKISMKLWGKPDQVDKLYDLNKAAIGPNKANLKAGMVLKLPEAPTAISTR